MVGRNETLHGALDLTIDFLAGFQVEPGQNVELTVKSNHPSFPLIKVPVFVPQFPRNPADGPVKVPTAAKN